jgi:putative transposase
MRRSLFQVDELAKLFVRTLYEYRVQDKYLLHEFVVMRNHVHLIITPAEVTLERAMQLIKGGFSHRVREAGRENTEVWQRGFTDHRIRDVEDFERHRSYIYMNPVRGGMCLQPAEYLFSSANALYKKDPIPQRLKPSSLAVERHG